MCIKMASGGVTRAIESGSDVYYDRYCTLCSADGRNVEAVKFCVDCDEYFCQKCIQDHNRFGRMKTHHIRDIDRKDVTIPVRQQATPLPADCCQVHPGKVLDKFCPTHDTVCCGTCVSLQHRTCKGMKFLQTASAGIQQSKEFRKTKENVHTTQLQLNKMKFTKQEELGSLKKEKTTILAQIKNFRNGVMKQIDKMEKTAIDELHARHEKFQKQINADIRSLEEMLTSMETCKNKLETDSCGNESNLFKDVKTVKKKVMDGRKVIEDMDTFKTKRTLKFKVNTNIEKCFENQKTLGDFIHEEHLYSASLQGKYTMKIRADRSPCYIIGSCELDDGTIIVVDYGNKRLKRLKQSYQVRDYCDMPCGECSGPFAVCAIGQDEVAVSLELEKEVQFVCVRNKMTLTRSFSVGGDYKCRYRYCCGIAYANNQLFVASCPGAVQVYDMSGTLLKTTQYDSNGQYIFSDPRHVTPSRDQSKLYIADVDKGLITIGINGDMEAKFTDPALNFTHGVCISDSGEIFACGFHSHNVIQISRDGRKLGIVLNEGDGIRNPKSVQWDRTNSRLIVTMFGNNHIKVFDMQQK